MVWQDANTISRGQHEASRIEVGPSDHAVAADIRCVAPLKRDECVLATGGAISEIVGCEFLSVKVPKLGLEAER